jgi:copper chaperone CopZ
MREMVTANYEVRGMTCGHCAAAVTEEVTKIPGVSDVEVDVAAGRVTVSSAKALDATQVRSAVDEAGYELVGA